MDRSPCRRQREVSCLLLKPGKRRFCLLALACLISSCMSEAFPGVPGNSQETPAPVELKHRNIQTLIRGKSIEAQLSEDPIHSYALQLLPGKFVQSDFYSSSSDLLVSLVWPGGQKSLEWSVPKRVPTPISWLADINGTYRLDVRNVKNEEGSGVYRLEIKALRRPRCRINTT